MASPHRRDFEPHSRLGAGAGGSRPQSSSSHNNGNNTNIRHINNVQPAQHNGTTPAITVGAGDIQLMPNPQYNSRRPVGSRPIQQSQTPQNIPSVVSTSGRGSRSSTISSTRPPTIRLRRLPSATDLNDAYEQIAPQPTSNLAAPAAVHTRQRSASDPARHSWLNDPNLRSSQIMSPVQEHPPEIPPTPPPKIPLADDRVPHTPLGKAVTDTERPPTPPPKSPDRPQFSRFGSTFSLAGARSLLGMKQRMEDVNGMMTQPPPPRKPLPPPRQEYSQDVVDLLDVLDPEVSTLSTLTNVQNSLFIPNLGTFLNRHPTYDLSLTSQRGSSRRASKVEPTAEDVAPEDRDVPDETTSTFVPPSLQRQVSRAMSISSNLTDSHYAVLPHGVRIDDWSAEDKAMLDDHVRHLMHSKKEKFKRGWRGFVQYVKRPMGFFVTLYATLITLFGLAWVLFLIGWIYVGEQQVYAINVIDNVLVALFAIVGDGLAPFRAVDTYHMIYIAHYHHLTWKLRKKSALPELKDHNDLPTREFVPLEDDSASVLMDLEAARERKGEDPVLTEKQQEKFEHHSTKFAKSHTYYRPHETRTHHAFPVKLLITVTILLDFHSIFQIALGACTWGIDYKVRPGALTAAILSCSICCNIAAGITISIGDRKSRKKRIIEQQFRQELTEEAIGHVKKKKKQKEKASLADLEGKESRNGDEFKAVSGISSSLSSIDEKDTGALVR